MDRRNDHGQSMIEMLFFVVIILLAVQISFQLTQESQAQYRRFKPNLEEKKSWPSRRSNR